MAQGGLRKRPVQERSRATTQKILDTATRLLVEVGYDAIVGSPTLLLHESGVSRGSFYSFFESPVKVLEELAYQSMTESAAMLGDTLEPGRAAHWHDVVNGLVDFYVDSFKRPVVRELWVGENLTPPMREADREWVRRVAEMWLAAFEAFDPPLFGRLEVRQCVVGIEILERLFQHAFTEHVDGDPLIIDEIRIVLVQYFSTYADTEPAARPRRSSRKVAVG